MTWQLSTSIKRGLYSLCMAISMIVAFHANEVIWKTDAVTGFCLLAVAFACVFASMIAIVNNAFESPAHASTSKAA